jgi:hypothetical protein
MFDLNTRRVTKGDSTEKKPERNKWARYSPDSTYITYAKNHNLYMMMAGDKDSVENQLTEDGERWFSYAADQGDTVQDEKSRARVSWFKDEKKFYVNRSDSRKVEQPKTQTRSLQVRYARRNECSAAAVRDFRSDYERKTDCRH